MSKANYLEDKLLDHVLGGTTFTQPTNVYLALHTSDPGEDDSGTEVSGGGYARQVLSFAAASGGAKASNAEIQFPIATASWGTVTHYGVYDAASGGNLLYYGALSASISVGIDNQIIVPSGELTVTED